MLNRVANATMRRFGPWEVRFGPEGDRAIIPAHVRAEIEAFVNEKYLPAAMGIYREDNIPNFSMTRAGIPSPVIRVDMPPAYEGFRDLYEAEANPSGIALCHLLGFPIVSRVIEALRLLGVDRVGWFIAPSRKDQLVEHGILMKALQEAGLETIQLSDEIEGSDIPLWLRAGQEDLDRIPRMRNLMPMSLPLQQYGRRHKDYLCTIGNATPIGTFSEPQSVFDRYSNGFCIKPQATWGSESVKVWARDKVRGAVNRRKMEQLLGMLLQKVPSGIPAPWLVQQFQRPMECAEGFYWIWRLFLVYTANGYKAVGGFETGRSTIVVHGASDAVTVPLVCED